MANNAFSFNDRTAEFDATDISNNKVMGVLSYFGILVLIPIFAAKGSKFARFHANQGLVLFVLGIVGNVLAIIPVVGSIISGLLGLVILVFSIIGIVHSIQGKAVELPVVGGFKILK